MAKKVMTYAEKAALAKKQKNKKIAKVVVIAVAIAIVVGLLVFLVVNQISTNSQSSTDTGSESTEADLTVTNRVEMSVEGFGIMKIELYGNEAPETVENFMSYVNSGFYDGITFHRIINGFMIQGGDPAGTGRGTSDLPTIKGEFSSNGVTNNIKHELGVISMARGSDPDSASSQFFICNVTNANVSNLDGSYAAFGKVYEGLDVLDAISNVEVEYNSLMGEQSSPVEPVVIEYIKEITE